MRGFAAGLIVCAIAGGSYGHYGMIIPSDNMVSTEDGRSVELSVSFSHPFELVGMTLAMPEAFTVTHMGTTTSIKDSLEPAKIMGHEGFRADYRLERPGAYVFSMTPQPYWEPEEDAFITHFTKTYVAAYGDDTGWDTPLGLKTEIVPLAKPFAQWSGNVFQGIVMLDGNHVPYAEVEVEYYNQDGSAKAPSDLMVTQTIKADENGVFTYAVPHSGWWGFAALNTADTPLMHNGEEKDHELGAVIWVHFEPWAHNGQ